MLGQAVQPGLLLGQHLHRRPPGHPMRAGVDVRAELLARRFQTAPMVIDGQQVRLGGHQVGLGHLHGRLRASLAGRIRRHAGHHRQPVAGRLPLSGLRIGIRATWSTVTVFSLSVNAVGNPPNRRRSINTAPWAASCPGWPSPPGTGTTPATRRTTPLTPRPRAVAEVVLEPQTRLGGRPQRRPPLPAARPGARPARRPAPTRIPRHNLYVRSRFQHDLPLAPARPLFQLGRPLITAARAAPRRHRRPASSPPRASTWWGRPASSRRPGGPSGHTPRDVHDLPGRLARPSRSWLRSIARWPDQEEGPPAAEPAGTDGGLGRSRSPPPGGLMSASGPLTGRVWAVSSPSSIHGPASARTRIAGAAGGCGGARALSPSSAPGVGGVAAAGRADQAAHRAERAD